jgi:hypothetical protein
MDAALTDYRLIPFVLHALSCLLATHAANILGLELGVHFLNRLLLILTSSVGLRPLILQLVVDAFAGLLPIISSSLVDQEIAVLVYSIIEALRWTPYEFAKHLYFSCLPCVLIFAPQYGHLCVCRFPRRSSDIIKIAASGAISALLKMNGKLEFECLNDLFLLLHKSQSQQVLNCIAGIGSCPTPDQGFQLGVLSIINSVFIRNSLPGYSTIEPSKSVKTAALSLVPVIIEAHPREALQVTAKVLEARLEKQAFSILEMITRQHKAAAFLVTIRPQLTYLTAFALRCDLSNSAGFLLEYLSADTVSDILVDLMNCTQRNSEFFEIIVKACILLSQLQLRPISFLEFAFPFLEELSENAVSLTPVFPDFRTFASRFYSDLFRAFFWAAALVDPLFDCRQYFAFLTIELSATKERWRIESALRGLAQIILSFPNQIDGDSLRITFGLVISLFPAMNGVIEDEIRSVCRAVCTIGSIAANIMDMLLYITLRIACDSKAVAILLRFYGPDVLRIICVRLLPLVSSLPPLEQLASLTILCGKVPEACAMMDGNSRRDYDLAFAFYTLCIRARRCADWAHLAEFGRKNFRPFGIALALEAIDGELVEALPELVNAALHRFVEGEFDLAPFLCHFIQKFGHHDAIATAILVATFPLLAVATNPTPAIQIIKSVNKANRLVLNSAWNHLDASRKTEIVRLMLRSVMHESP